MSRNKRKFISSKFTQNGLQATKTYAHNSYTRSVSCAICSKVNKGGQWGAYLEGPIYYLGRCFTSSLHWVPCYNETRYGWGKNASAVLFMWELMSLPSSTTFLNTQAGVLLCSAAVAVLTTKQHLSFMHLGMLWTFSLMSSVRIPGSSHVYSSNGIENMRRVRMPLLFLCYETSKNNR